MDIPLIVNWRKKFKTGNAKVDPLGPKGCKIIDRKFDRLHSQGCMDWNGSMLFPYPCFVVWTTKADGTRKRNTVIDIKALNKTTAPDVSPMLLQLTSLQTYKNQHTFQQSTFGHSTINGE